MTGIVPCPRCREPIPPGGSCDACSWCAVCHNAGTVTRWRGTPLRRVVDWCACPSGVEAQADPMPPPSEAELARHYAETMGDAPEEAT